MINYARPENSRKNYDNSENEDGYKRSVTLKIIKMR